MGEAAGAVGGGVGLADLQAALDLDVLSGLGSLGGSSLRRTSAISSPMALATALRTASLVTVAPLTPSIS